MIFFIPALLALFVILRLILPLPVSGQLKILFSALTILAGSKYLFFSFITGSLASPEAPRWLLLAANWLFVALLLLFFLVIFKDAALILIRIGDAVFHFGRPGPGTRIPAALALTAVALGLSAYGVWQAVRIPGVRTVEITLPQLPPELDGLTVVHLSDLHVSKLMPRERTAGVTAAVNALNPDLILITGDLVDGNTEVRADDAAPLKDLRAKYGVYACVGNHEYYSGLHPWLAAFKNLGLKTLYNEQAVLAINGRQLVLAGVTDPVAVGPRFKEKGPDLRAALAGAPAGAPVVLLAHRPAGAAENAAAGVALQLSGHTHGGLMWGFRALVGRFNEGYVAGLYQVGGMKLYVSPGTGLWNGLPVRLGVPGEITRFMFRPGPGNETRG